MFTKNLGGQFFYANLNNRKYELIDPKEFVVDLFTFPVFPTDHWEIISIIIIGGMGSGKTTTVNYLSDLCEGVYTSQLHAFQTNDLVYALKGLNQKIETRKKVEFISIDDAMASGYDARRSMSGENVNISQNFAVGRHLLANENKYGVPDKRVMNGVAFVIFCIQSPSRLDKFIRENAHLTIYKEYYNTLEQDRRFDPEDIQYIKDVTYESAIKHNYHSRQCGLGITRDGRVLRVYTSRINKKLPVIINENNVEDDLLKNLIYNINLREIKPILLKGYILEYCEKRDVTIPQKRIPDIICKATYQQISKGITPKGKKICGYNLYVKNCIDGGQTILEASSSWSELSQEEKDIWNKKVEK